MQEPRVISTTCVLELPPTADVPRCGEGDFSLLAGGGVLYVCSVSVRGDGLKRDGLRFYYSENGGAAFSPLESPFTDTAARRQPTLLSGPDGGLLLLCTEDGAFVSYRLSFDGGKLSAGGKRVCIPEKKGTAYTVENGAVTRLTNGSILIPAAKYPARRFAAAAPIDAPAGRICFYKGNETGTSFAETAGSVAFGRLGHSGGLTAPGVVELPDGRLCVYFATGRHFQYVSFSFNGGKSWSAPVPSAFSSPVSPMRIRRDPFTGIFWAVYNPVPLLNTRCERQRRFITGGRTPLALAYSSDGVNFSDPVLIETDPVHGFTSPAFCFPAADTMLLSVSCGGVEDGDCRNRSRLRLLQLERCGVPED
ncbi:MAG: exo-alpha-sialidase [Clostridia bacterium]|nr:exo-alpha-sialidase [Clostridia bacterium]